MQLYIPNDGFYWWCFIFQTRVGHTEFGRVQVIFQTRVGHTELGGGARVLGYIGGAQVQVLLVVLEFGGSARLLAGLAALKLAVWE